MKENLGLYIHIPFCARKCNYCDFLSSPQTDEVRHRYTDALINEIRETGGDGRPVTSVFIGGGTPSLMPADDMERIMGALRETYRLMPEAEITMEVNPGTLSDGILAFIGRHINRVSMGLQSANDSELMMLGRIHTKETAEESFWRLREAGVKNINLDLMSGLPGQSMESWMRTLGFAAGLDPEHISAYSLIIEEGTPFYDLMGEGKLSLPGEETERAMYYAAKEFLGERGYTRYEISNYAKEGRVCRHNIRYWRREPYRGFGIGAASLDGHERWKNTEDLTAYLEGNGICPREEAEILSVSDEMAEFMFLGLRMSAGVTEESFKASFGRDINEVYGAVLSKFTEEGLLTHKDARYALTDRGFDVSNIVMSEFLL